MLHAFLTAHNSTILTLYLLQHKLPTTVPKHEWKKNVFSRVITYVKCERGVCFSFKKMSVFSLQSAPPGGEIILEKKSCTETLLFYYNCVLNCANSPPLRSQEAGSSASSATAG